jgi:hypothetical protein
MRLVTYGLAMVLVSGCDREEFVEPLADEVDASELTGFRKIIDNGIVPNGFEINGIRWNGIRWNGIRWNGIRWNGVELNSSLSLTDIALDPESGGLVGRDSESNLVALEPTDELVATGDDESGTGFELRISEVEQLTSGSTDFQFQRVQTRLLPSGTWQDACRDGAGDPVKAILLKGDWVPPTYERATGTEAEQASTWACRGAALAKCVEWGYHPEASHSGTPLADHHQACTRMIRADYCGTGEHHTENGTMIDVQDSLGINVHESTWSIEAAWGPRGALCVNVPRKTWWTRTQALDECSSVPSCDANANGLDDDTSYWLSQGALLVTRSTPSVLLESPPAPADSGG